jgi:hypothetical protein
VNDNQNNEIRDEERSTNHVRGPAVLAGDENARRVSDTSGNDNLLDLVTKSILDGRTELLEGVLVSLASLLLLLGLFELETLLRHADKLLAVELLELSDSVLVDWVDEEKDFKALLLKGLQEGRLLDGGERLAGKVIDRLLNLRHAGDVIYGPPISDCMTNQLRVNRTFEGSLLLRRLG